MRLTTYLHERTFIELEKGNLDDWAKVRERTTAIATELQAILDSSGWGLKFTRTHTIPCDCGDTANYKMGPMQLRSRARCAACSANYEIWREYDEAPTVKAKLLGA